MHDFEMSRELRGLKLGDHRLHLRASRILDAIALHPGVGFPSALGSEAEVEAFYRFVNNDAVTPDALLAPHSSESWLRAQAKGAVALVLHDTSEFVFRGETPRQGLTQKSTTQSFHGHYALAVAEGVAPVVHGVVGQRSYVIEDKTWLEASGEREEFVELLSGSERWTELVSAVGRSAPSNLSIVHVADREADDYALWTCIVEQGDDFVIRAKHNRRLFSANDNLFIALEDEPFVVSREVKLSRRSNTRLPGSKRTHPPREHRPARLSIRAGRAEVKRPVGTAPLGDPTMTLSVVEVVEIDPPFDATPIHWLLLSTLPVDSSEDMLRVVDIYRKRWLIEEFFKSIKTGCAAEKRQARTLWSLLNTIALLTPVAWRLLAMRAMARHEPDASADRIVDEVELAALRHIAKDVKLPRRPSCRQVMLAVARVGGHLKSNGEPGWLVLGRGFERLLDVAAGWRAALMFASNQGDGTM
jgi:hypothetical protein